MSEGYLTLKSFYRFSYLQSEKFSDIKNVIFKYEKMLKAKL